MLEWLSNGHYNVTARHPSFSRVDSFEWMFRDRNRGRRGLAKGKVFAWMRDSRIRKERDCHLATSPVIRVAPTLNVVIHMKMTRYAHSQIESDKCRWVSVRTSWEYVLFDLTTVSFHGNTESVRLWKCRYIRWDEIGMHSSPLPLSFPPVVAKTLQFDH